MTEITLDRLFRVSKELELPDETKVTVRALGDAERKERHRFALGESMRLDRSLRNTDSNEYLALVYPIENAEDNILQQVLLDWKKVDAKMESVEVFKYEFIPVPDKASDEEEKEVLEKRKEHEKDIDNKRDKYVKDQVDTFKEKVLQFSRDMLVKEALERKKWMVSREESWNTTIDYTVWKSVEKDGKPYFRTFQEVKDLDSSVKTILFNANMELEAINPWEISKKSSGRNDVGVVDSGEASSVETS